MAREFSFRSRAENIQRLSSQEFDLLVIGGGITGAAVARDAASRGLNVAVIDARDFAWGTSSRSSKLIHGGLRYLENMEFQLVFEALAERSFLLKTVPHLVRPIRFYLPHYQGDPKGRGLIALGLWLYDLLSLFRTPGFHKGLSKNQMLAEIPFLNAQGLRGGFRYYDASMWDDVMAVETLRSAQLDFGACVANYVEALTPVWDGNRIVGFEAKDQNPEASSSRPFKIRARMIVSCTGPWTDQFGSRLSSHWKTWLSPSKGVHLVFDLKKIPVPGAMVMSHPNDGRIAFVIPRPDMGGGIVIVGTTDGPTSAKPEEAFVDSDDVQYLIQLLTRYFPDLKITPSDILSAYVGVRPLMMIPSSTSGSEGQPKKARGLQKISREHYIGVGQGEVVMVAGGKYTTHRRMAGEIVDFTLQHWKVLAKHGQNVALPKIQRAQTHLPLNRDIFPEPVSQARTSLQEKGLQIPEHLFAHYGTRVLDIVDLVKPQDAVKQGGEEKGFEYLEARLRYSIRNEMVLRLEDFFIRRSALFLACRDHGSRWIKTLAQVWAQEMGVSSEVAQREAARIQNEILQRTAWKQGLAPKKAESNGSIGKNAG